MASSRVALFFFLLVATQYCCSSGFLVKVPTSASSIVSSSPRTSCLQMAMVTTVPPPQEKIVNVASTTPTIPVSPSNLPSQKELAQKSANAPTATISPSTKSSPPATAAPKSTNLAAAASGVGLIISDVHYNGDVPKTEADEYVVISNNLKTPVDVSGYCLYVATNGTPGAAFTFDSKANSIPPGKAIRVYTNEIHKETGGYSFGSGKAIWNNKGGLAVLKDAKGKKVMEYKYSGTS